MHNNHLYAALDLGSNTCRLMIKRLSHNNLVFVDSYAQTIRLAEGIDQNNHISQASIDRTRLALENCKVKLDEHKPTFFRAVATEACRVASNAQELMEIARQEFGINIEIISAQEEALLSLRGCEELLDDKKSHAIVFDIGGASTEVLFLAFNRKKHEISIYCSLSLPYGVVRISETYGPYMKEVFANIRQQVRDKILELLGPFKIRALARAHKLQLLGCSGTATTIAALALNLKAYDRRIVDGCRIPIDSIESLAQLFLNQDTSLQNLESEKSALLGKRDLIEPGLAILLGICDVSPFPSLRVADRGVRDGIITDLAQRQFQDQVRDGFFHYHSLQPRQERTA